MGRGKGGSGSTKTTIRYAPYIEDAHEWLLETTKTYVESLKDSSPLSGFTAIPVDVGFFGTGFIMSDFPSLYDMGGKFVFGLDVDILFDQIYEETVNAPAVNDLVASESDDLDDIIDGDRLEFESGMHDINSLQSSAFVIGKALIETKKVQAVSKFSATTRVALIPTATERWGKHLEWNRGAITLYGEMMKLFFTIKSSIDKYNYEMTIADTLWPFAVLDYERVAVGTLNGATTSKTKESGGGGGWLSGVLGIAGLATMFIP